MERTVQAVASQCGVSVRTLHYYDEIGLLSPSRAADSDYRLYSDGDIARLQQILLFREMKMPLKQIAAVMNAPGYDQQSALHHHRRVLALERARLDKLIALVDHQLKGEILMDFEAFDMDAIEQAQREYSAEAQARWGHTDAYKESARRAKKYGKEDWARIQAEMDSVYRAMIDAMPQGAHSEAARDAVAAWQAVITRSFYPCTDEILAGLGEMYVADERFTKNIDRQAEGLALFMSDAIRAYCAHRAAQ